MSDKTWSFRGREMSTYGDVSDVMNSLYRADDRAGAAEFMAAYRAFTEHADANVGYITGYFGDMGALQEFFDVSHPIFGRTVPTQEEALAAGAAMARASDRGLVGAQPDTDSSVRALRQRAPETREGQS